MKLKTSDIYNSRLDLPDHTISNYYLFINIILKMLDYDPTTRITLSVALEHVFFKENN